MHLKLKNSWKSEMLTWIFPITFCSWVYAIQSSDQHNFSKHFGVTSWRRTKSYKCHGCFNFLNIYTTTKCKWDFMLDASTIQLVQLQNANDILGWMLQLTQHIQLQNTNEDLKGNNYKMNANTKRLAQLHFLYKTTPGWQSVL